MTTDGRLRRARALTLVTLAVNAASALLLPAVGLWREPDPRWRALGAAGVLLFAVAHGVALYGVATPWLTAATRRRGRLAFAAAAVASVPLVAPAGAGWPTWAWLGASVVGTAFLLTGRAAALAVVAAAVAAGAVLGGGDLTENLVVTGGVGLGIAAVNGLQVWFWDLLLEADRGRAAQARLAATEERLRFARDVHDLLGHSLSVIALKAELAARSADPARARAEAAEVRELAAAALAELREVVHGYRAVDLREQLAAIAQVLTSSGVRCTVTAPDGDLPAAAAGPLSAVLREASTNLLRHSRAAWCAIELTTGADGTRLTVTNDGAAGAAADRHSSGLRGLADRLAEAGGTLSTRNDGDRFTVDARMPG